MCSHTFHFLADIVLLPPDGDIENLRNTECPSFTVHVSKAKEYPDVITGMQKLYTKY